MKSEEISLVIDAFNPETFPMARLAIYLREYAAMLGNEASIHFARVGSGSTALVACPEVHAMPKVEQRLREVVDGTAPKPALKAHKTIDDLLAEDNAIGHICVGKAKALEFPGRRRATLEKIGPIRRSTSIEGQIFQIGGKDETINVHVRDGEKICRCEVSVKLAKLLAPYFLSGKIRLFGQGDWYRVDGEWIMTTFEATDFVPLDGRNLTDTIEALRQLFDDESSQDIIATMSELRHG
jgi:hypothetical protein